MKKVLILGGGTGGTNIANHLRKLHNTKEMTITVVDRDDVHIYQPGLLFIPFGIYKPEEIVRPRLKQLSSNINHIFSEIDRVEHSANQVHLKDGQILDYDLLVIATGAEILPEETEGLTGTGWQKNMFDFYTLEGAKNLAQKLGTWQGGRLVINVVDMPIKCPVAPLEFAFLADWYFHKRGIRDKVEIIYATPLDGAFTKPMASKFLQNLLSQKNIILETEFNTATADGKNSKLVAYDEREIPFDLLVSIPIHGGSSYIEKSPGLGDELNFVITDKNTLQAKCAANIFAIGDVTTLPTSKAGSVTHFAAEVLVENILAWFKGEELPAHFDGHANCFIETGFKRALLIDFNYETEPLPGHFPFAFGPMALLKETRLNHLGKMMFSWLYWNFLLPARPLPGIPSKMSLKGKKTS